MAIIKPHQIREKLTSDSARAAFDRMNALKPRWVVSEHGDEVYVCPAINVRPPGSDALHALPGGAGATLDQGVTAKFAALMKEASEPGAIVVVNTSTPQRAEFFYNPATKIFMPFVSA